MLVSVATSCPSSCALTALMSAARPMGAQRGGEQRQIVLQCGAAAKSRRVSPQPVAIRRPLVHGLYSFPPSATSAGGVPDTLLPGLQRGVTGTSISAFHFASAFVSPLQLCPVIRSAQRSLWRCFTAGGKHGCCVAC